MQNPGSLEQKNETITTQDGYAVSPSIILFSFISVICLTPLCGAAHKASTSSTNLPCQCCHEQLIVFSFFFFFESNYC